MKLGRLVALVFAVSMGYAVVRYVGFKGLSWAHLPLFLTNKAVSMVALFLLGLAFVSRARERRRAAGLGAFAAASLHGLLSLVTLAGGQHPKLLPAGPGALAANAEASLLLGALALVLLGALAWPRGGAGPASWLRTAVAGLLLFTAAHTALIGAAGWLKPETWPGGLPPITLLSSVFALAALGWGLYQRPGGASGDAGDNERSSSAQMR